METNRILNNMENNYSYIIRIEIGAHKISMVVRNIKEVPRTLIEQMAQLRIKKHINDTFTNEKHYRSQTHEQYHNKMIQLSNYEIEDLSAVEVYDLNVTFKNNQIENSYDKTKRVEIRESKINREFVG